MINKLLYPRRILHKPSRLVTYRVSPRAVLAEHNAVQENKRQTAAMFEEARRPESIWQIVKPTRLIGEWWSRET